MFQLMGLVILGIWAGKKAMAHKKNPYVWGLIAGTIFLVSYAILLYGFVAVFKQMFPDTGRVQFSTQVASLGLIVICFAITTLIIERVLYQQDKSH